VNQPPRAGCEASYELCAQIAKKATSSFYWAFSSLGREKRHAMLALYAFARVSDDIVDSDEPVERRRARLAELRDDLHRALARQPAAPFLAAVADTVHRFGIPTQCLTDILDGVAMDLEPKRYETFAELELYCHRVATAVGLACVHIWGFQQPERAIPLVHQCGLAFQLTNILRDLKEDAANERVYLPREELARFCYRVDDLQQGIVDDRFQGLMRFQIARARRLFTESRELEQYLAADGRRIFPLLHDTYFRLLEAISRRSGDVFRRRIRLGMTERLRIAWAQWRRARGTRASQHAIRS
jgi:15-cis-phytoene synthase